MPAKSTDKRPIRTRRPKPRRPYVLLEHPDPAISKTVLMLAGFGMKPDQIANVIAVRDDIAISVFTINNKYKQELRAGTDVLNSQVSRSLFQMTQLKDENGNPDPRAAGAIMFWLKTRAHWKEAPTAVEINEKVTVEYVIQDRRILRDQIVAIAHKDAEEEAVVSVQ